MNREERRKVLKSINTPQKFSEALNYGLDRQRRDMQEHFDNQKRQMVEIVMTMTAYTLQYKLGFGKKRLPEIMGAIFNNLDAFTTGHLSKEDYEFIREDLKRYNFYVE